MRAEGETSEPYRFGIVFSGQFPDQDAADAAVGRLEHYMVTELGFTEVRGGARDSEKALCSCESASECDERPGCVFT